MTSKWKITIWKVSRSQINTLAKSNLTIENLSPDRHRDEYKLKVQFIIKEKTYQKFRLKNPMYIPIIFLFLNIKTLTITIKKINLKIHKHGKSAIDYTRN